MSLRIIGGIFKGRLLKTPKSNSTRPTQGMLRESVFNICQHEIEGACFLDLFAGSGSMGLEAISRGASLAVFIENHPQAAKCIKENISILKVESQTQLFTTSSHQALDQLKKKKLFFELVYIDPPYAMKAGEYLDQLPALLAPTATVFIEEKYSAKSQQPPYESPFFTLKSSRRFGIALLHQYRFSGR